MLEIVQLLSTICTWIYSTNVLYRGVEKDMNEEEGGGVLMTIGVLCVFVLLIHGCVAVRIPLKRLKGQHRVRNMQRQGGHTLMLCYFLGIGAFCESYLSTSSSQKFRAACSKQLYFLSIPISLIQVLSLIFLSLDVFTKALTSLSLFLVAIQFYSLK